MDNKQNKFKKIDVPTKTKKKRKKRKPESMKALWSQRVFFIVATIILAGMLIWAYVFLIGSFKTDSSSPRDKLVLDWPSEELTKMEDHYSSLKGVTMAQVTQSGAVVHVLVVTDDKITEKEAISLYTNPQVIMGQINEEYLGTFDISVVVDASLAKDPFYLVGSYNIIDKTFVWSPNGKCGDLCFEEKTEE